MRCHGVDRIVFLSTATVFGPPQAKRVDEDHSPASTNPCSAIKSTVRRMREEAARAHDACVPFRCSLFNAAGASSGSDICEVPGPEYHLLPNVLARLGNKPEAQSATIAQHLLALNCMAHHSGAHAFNLGNGNDYSAMQIVRPARASTETHHAL